MTDRQRDRSGPGSRRRPPRPGRPGRAGKPGRKPHKGKGRGPGAGGRSRRPGRGSSRPRKGGPGAGPRSKRGPERAPDAKRGRRPDRKPAHAGVGAQNLPRWMRDEIHRVTRKERRDAALLLLSGAVDSYGAEAFPAARRKLLEAKQLSPRSSTIRELLGLSSYRCQKWEEALAELRAYRRLAGDTTYMPVEMDALRALERHRDVEVAWGRFVELGGDRPTEAEARVVYASYLLDRGRAAEAWTIAGPDRLRTDAQPYERRCWFVAARAALAMGEVDLAGQLLKAIRRADPEMPGLEDLLHQAEEAGPGRN